MISLIIFTALSLFQTEDCYQSAYNHLTNDPSVVKILNDTFRKSLKKREIKSLSFCIDTFAYNLNANGFSEIDRDPKSIRTADYGSVPSGLLKRSKCSCDDVTYNLEASILNERYLTLEVSSRKFNPEGGAAFGPSVKFLFLFDNSCNIESVWHQSYMNG